MLGVTELQGFFKNTGEKCAEELNLIQMDNEVAESDGLSSRTLLELKFELFYVSINHISLKKYFKCTSVNMLQKIRKSAFI